MYYTSGDDVSHLLYEIINLDDKTPDQLGRYKFTLFGYEELGTKETTWTEYIYDINLIAERIQTYFKRGRILINTVAHGMKCVRIHRLTAKQAKAMLTFEHNASRFIREKHKAIQLKRPTLIDRSLDCGLYILEAWPLGTGTEKQRYTAISVDPKINEWINQIRTEYPSV
jgi:hypothetical protein